MLKSRGSVHWPRVPQFGQAISARPCSGARPLLRLELLLEVVGAEPLVAGQALGQRVGEHADVAGGHPHLAGQDDRGVEADDVVAAGDHGLPPLPLDVLLELDAERPVVPGRAGAAVDLAGREDEPPPLAEADHFVETAGRSHVSNSKTASPPRPRLGRSQRPRLSRGPRATRRILTRSSGRRSHVAVDVGGQSRGRRADGGGEARPRETGLVVISVRTSAATCVGACAAASAPGAAHARCQAPASGLRRRLRGRHSSDKPRRPAPLAPDGLRLIALLHPGPTPGSDRAPAP